MMTATTMTKPSHVTKRRTPGKKGLVTMMEVITMLVVISVLGTGLYFLSYYVTKASEEKAARIEAAKEQVAIQKKEDRAIKDIQSSHRSIDIKQREIERGMRKLSGMVRDTTIKLEKLQEDSDN